MSKMRILALCAGLGAGAACVGQSLADETVTLAIKPGLWEMTTQSQNSGTPPIPPEALANMTPDQRQKFEAAMAAHMAKQKEPHVYKHCVTEDQLKRGFTLDKPEKDCKKTVKSNTGKVLEVHVECTGGDPAKPEHTAGDFYFEAVDSATMAGKTDMTISRGAQSMNIKTDMHGKWLAADCGDLKPDGDATK